MSQTRDRDKRERADKTTRYVIRVSRAQITNDHSPSWTYIFGLTFSCQAARARVTVATKHQQDSNGCILGTTRRLARLILCSRWCRSDARNDVPGFAVSKGRGHWTTIKRHSRRERKERDLRMGFPEKHRVLSPSHCAPRATRSTPDYARDATLWRARINLLSIERVPWQERRRALLSLQHSLRRKQLRGCRGSHVRRDVPVCRGRCIHGRPPAARRAHVFPRTMDRLAAAERHIQAKSRTRADARRGRTEDESRDGHPRFTRLRASTRERR